MKEKLATIAAVLIVLSSAALGTPSLLRALRSGARPAAENISVDYFEKRFIPAKSHLPASGVTGYYSDEKENVPRTARYLYARIILAPRVLAFDADREFVLADILAPGGRVPRGFDVVKDFGGGVLLLRKIK